MDRYQHQYGPDHYLSKAALTAADYNIGLLRRAIEDSGLDKQTTLLVVSDHGFQTATHSVNVFPPFEQAGLLGKVNLHSGYWSVFVELTKDFDPAHDQKTLEDVFRRVAALEGIGAVFGPDDFHALGLPRYEEDPHLLGQYFIIGQIDSRAVIDEQTSSTKRLRLATPVYGHGYLPSDERMYPLFLAAGRRIKEGIRVGHFHNYDIAPTVAELLGLHLEGLEGRVLTEILH
jgi:Type I phosphodiesterase / nucleotide pyrophosphatase